MGYEVAGVSLDKWIPNWRQRVGGHVLEGQDPTVEELDRSIPGWREAGSAMMPFNPPPDASLLPKPERLDTSLEAINKLQQPTDYSSLLDFANQSGGAEKYLTMLPGAGKKFSDFYKAPEDTSDKAFQDYLTKINAPGSTEETRKRLESDALTQTLADIDRDTERQIADLKMSMQERGIGGPGQTSDIEQVALAQAGAAGGRTKAQARTTLQAQQLEREAGKEKLVAEAYGTRYGAEVAKTGQERQLAAAAATTDVQAANQLLQLAFTTGVQTQESQMDRMLKAKEVVAGLSSQEKMNTLNNLYEMLIDQAQNEVDREKIRTTFDAAKIDANNAYNIALLRRDPEPKNSMWENLFSTLITSGAGGVATGVGTAAGGGIVKGLGKIFK